jgi:hypothetical protein
MSEDRITMSIAEYAKARNVSDETIRHQINLGNIRRVARGQIDPAQADAAWFRVRRAPGSGRPPRDETRIRIHHDDQGRRSAEAKIVAGFAKLRLAKDRLEQVREQYLNRKEVAAQAIAEAHAFLAALDDIPQRYSQQLADLTGLEPARAYDLLARFNETVKAEIGNLVAEAARTAEAA